MPRTARPQASDQLPRQWTLLRLLSSHGAAGSTVRDLAEQVQSGKSNVERDLAALQAAGFQLEVFPDPEHRQRKRWRLLEPATGAAPGFGAAELLALYAASCMLEFLGNTPIHMDLQAALAKVRAGLAGSGSKAVANMAGVFTPHLRDFVAYEGEERRAILDDLMDAAARRRACEVTYQASESKAPKTYVIHPLRLFGHHNALYAFVRIEPREDVRTLALSRILDVEVLAQEFEMPKMDLDAFSQTAFGVFIEDPQDIEVLFAPETARYVMERTFHPLEKKERLPGGGVRYRVHAGGRHEVVAWVLGFGGAARLVAPRAWREDVLERAKRIVETSQDVAGEAP